MPNIFRPCFALTSIALLLFSPSLQLSHLYAATLIQGDAIGPDSSLTDGRGGLEAFETDAGSLGQPAIEISQNGETLLDSIRIVLHGNQSTTGSLRFDNFNYRLKLWEKSNYLNGQPPQATISLSQPTNINFVQIEPNLVTPDTVFGESSFSPESFSRPNYAFQFDLSTAAFDQTTTPAFSTPLPTGDYIIAFQANHDPDSGTPLVAFSSSDTGPIPYFFEDVRFLQPRGILRDQDPSSITIRWAWNISEAPFADFDNDNDLDGNDFLNWQRRSTPEQGSPAELALWREQYNAFALPQSQLTAVPEPTTSLLALMAAACCLRPRLLRARAR